MTQIPSGWYPDPQLPTNVRWWDGTQWTDATQPAHYSQESPPQPYAPAAAFGPTYYAQYPEGYAPVALTFREWSQTVMDAKLRTELRSTFIVVVICAVVTLIVGATNLFGAGWYVAIDAAVVLGLGLGVWLAVSRICAIVLLAYGVCSMIVLLVESGLFGGWLIVVAGVFAVVNTTKAHKAWQAYQLANGIA
ncbi:MAG: DUF2510 domain-containing protein [Propionibacteriaceae bacterium]|jgi:hypothetical protein|nr:DUF2510 domain-containing protein [Propionibacteriaceae bacterium]